MATLNLIVGASSSDARQAGSTVTLGASDVVITGGTNRGGFRFAGVTVAQGSTVNSATLTLRVTNVNHDTPGGAIVRGQLSTDAAVFTTNNNDISDRPTTTANVTWSGTDLGIGDKNIDVTAIAQEIFSQGGWVSGNAMAFIVIGVTGTDLWIADYVASTSLCARLALDYTEPAAAAGAVKAMYYARQRSN